MMKYKIKNFFRKNKRCVGMWLMLYNLILCAISPNITTFAIAAFWCLYWRQECRVRKSQRLLGLVAESAKSLSWQMFQCGTECICKGIRRELSQSNLTDDEITKFIENVLKQASKCAPTEKSE